MTGRGRPMDTWFEVAVAVELGVIALYALVGLLRR